MDTSHIGSTRLIYVAVVVVVVAAAVVVAVVVAAKVVRAGSGPSSTLDKVDVATLLRRKGWSR